MKEGTNEPRAALTRDEQIVAYFVRKCASKKPLGRTHLMKLVYLADHEARRYLGGNPTGWAHDWCGRFMNLVLERTGHRGTGSNFALSFARYGRRLSGPQVGALAVMARRGGGHVGVVSGVLANGDVRVISGNHGHKVAESIYRRGRILAFVLPTA